MASELYFQRLEENGPLVAGRNPPALDPPETDVDLGLAVPAKRDGDDDAAAWLSGETL